MKPNKYSKNSVFLLEMIINIFLFCILTIVGLNFFIKAHTYSNNTEKLHQAVNCCDNIATVFEAGDGTSASIQNEYPTAVCSDNIVFIYYDGNYDLCNHSNAVYKATITITEENNVNLAKIVFNEDEEEIFSITASLHNPNTLSDMEVKPWKNVIFLTMDFQLFY